MRFFVPSHDVKLTLSNLTAGAESFYKELVRVRFSLRLDLFFFDFFKRIYLCCKRVVLDETIEVDLSRNGIVENALDASRSGIVENFPADASPIISIIDFNTIRTSFSSVYPKNSERLFEIKDEIFSNDLLNNIFVVGLEHFDWEWFIPSIAVLTSNALWNLIKLTETSFHMQLIIMLAQFEFNFSNKHCLTLFNNLANQAILLELYSLDDSGNIWTSIRAVEINYRAGAALDWWVENNKNLYDIFTNDSNKILDKVSYRIIKEDGITSLTSFKHSSAPTVPQNYTRILNDRDSFQSDSLNLSLRL